MQSSTRRRAPRPRPLRLAVGAVTLGLAVVLTPVISSGSVPQAAAQGSSNAPDHSAFYVPPAELPAESGTVIRSQPMNLFPSVPDLAGGGALPADAQRIMYRSTGSTGDPIAVTGTYMQPKTPWTGPGPRPLAIVTPGTQGQGDQCAPSKTMEVGLRLQTTPPSMGAGYTMLDAVSMLEQGFAVVVPDYEGLGTPGHHAYLSRESAGRTSLDAARAALRLPGPDLEPNSPAVATGYSQGGGAAGAVGELHPTYAPDINLVGIVAGAPPSDMFATLDHVDGGLITGAVGYAINGIIRSHPHLAPVFDAHLNDAGRRMLATTAGQCIPDTILSYGMHRTSEFTVDGRSLADVARSEPEIAAVIESYNLGDSAPAVPSMVLIGRNDDVIPYDTAVDLTRSWCDQGVPVQLHTAEFPSLAPGFVLDHGIPMVAERTVGAQYLKDRVLGLPAPSSCGTV